MLTIAAHPLLNAGVFVTRFDAALGELTTPPELAALLALDAETPLSRDERTRAAVRDLLRHGGHKPTGRGKPASEYLLRAVGEGRLPPINPAVDVCNIVSLHSGLPISVVDLGRAAAPFVIDVAPSGASYEFNASGQTISLSGLLCLGDREGPCANAVKDSQRTKTHAGTLSTLSVVWGTTALPGAVSAATAWYRQLLERAGATTEDVPLTGG